MTIIRRGSCSLFAGNKSVDGRNDEEETLFGHFPLLFFRLKPVRDLTNAFQCCIFVAQGNGFLPDNN